MIKTDESRRWWQYLLPVTADGRVLDIGAGEGALTFSLAKAGYKVVAADPDRKNIDLIEAKKDEDNVNNIETLCASVLELPFSESAFDVIVMNGLFGQDVINNMFRLLREGGVLCLAAKNRAGYQDLLRKAGFSDIRFFLPLPGYDDCKIMIPLGEKNVARYCATHVWNKRRVKLLKAALPLVKILPISVLMDWFGPDRCIIAKK